MDFHARADEDWAIKIDSLVKRYSGRAVLSGLNLSVPRGGVHGLLGPNGSGKTTSIRILLGLARSHAGSVQVLGYPVPKQLPLVIDRLGAVVESPKLSDSMTARGNLEVLAASIGVPRRRVTEVLLEVDLADCASQRFATMSLGQKQRLAIAATLLKRPEVLIFDEPTNGLDPEGIRDIRAALRKLGSSGRTVLVASHLLSEVEQVADSVSIIARGQTIAEGLMADLLSSGGGDVLVEVADVAGAAEVLRRSGWVVTHEAEGLVVRQADGSVPDSALVGRRLGEAGIWPRTLLPRSGSLERVFLKLTQEAQASGRAA